MINEVIIRKILNSHLEKTITLSQLKKKEKEEEVGRRGRWRERRTRKNCKTAHRFSSFQFSSIAQSCPTLSDPINCSMPGLPVHHQLSELKEVCLYLTYIS